MTEEIQMAFNDAIAAAIFFHGVVISRKLVQRLIDMSKAREIHGRDKSWMEEYTKWFTRFFYTQTGRISWR
jgi:hypothetical protein